VLGLISGAVSLAPAVSFFANWVIKELLRDNNANAGSLLVALNNVADLAIAFVGCFVRFCVPSGCRLAHKAPIVLR